MILIILSLVINIQGPDVIMCNLILLKNNLKRKIISFLILQKLDSRLLINKITIPFNKFLKKRKILELNLIFKVKSIKSLFLHLSILLVFKRLKYRDQDHISLRYSLLKSLMEKLYSDINPDSNRIHQIFNKIKFNNNKFKLIVT